MNNSKTQEYHLSYEAFCQRLQEHIRNYLDAGISLACCPVLKNNSVHYDGLILKQDGFCISPSFYLQVYYQRYCNGEELEELAEDILETWEKIRYQQKEYTEELADLPVEYSRWQDRIILRLVSCPRNQELLEEIPYIPFLDMAITFWCMIRKTEDGIASFRVSNELAAAWRTDTCSLLRTALENTMRIFPERIVPLVELLQDISQKDAAVPDEEAFPDVQEPLVLTNDIGVNGATVILYTGLLEKLAQRTQKNLYLLPSSIHEMLLLFQSEETDEEKLLSMVAQVNRECVSAEEILSDSVYCYDWQKKKIRELAAKVPGGEYHSIDKTDAEEKSL